MAMGACARWKLHAPLLQLLGLLQLSALWLALRGERGTASASRPTSTVQGVSAAAAASAAPRPRSARRQVQLTSSDEGDDGSHAPSCLGPDGACDLRAPVHGVLVDALTKALPESSLEATSSARRSRGVKRRRPTSASAPSSSPTCAFVHPFSVTLASAPAYTSVATAAGSWSTAAAAVVAAADASAARAVLSRASIPPRSVAWGPHAPGAGARLTQMSPLFAAGLLDGDSNNRNGRGGLFGRKRAALRGLLRFLFFGERSDAGQLDMDEQQRLAVAALSAAAVGASALSSALPGKSAAAAAAMIGYDGGFGAVSGAPADVTGRGRGFGLAAGTTLSASAQAGTTEDYARPRVRPRAQQQAADALLEDDDDEVSFAEAATTTPVPGVRIPLTSRVLKWAFERLIRMRATRVEGLEVYIAAKSNRKALSGNLQTVGLTWDALALPQLQITGGAKLQVTGVDLKVLFLVWRRFMAFKRPFEVSGYYVFTNNDFVASPLIRRMVQAMLSATLRKLEDYTSDRRAVQRTGINVLRVMVKKSKLVVDGEVQYDKFKVPFTYRTGLGVAKGGHVVYLRDPEVYWDNVGGALALPLVPLQAFDVDIGDNARIEHVSIKDGRLTVRARFVLSPFPPLVVADVSKRAAFRYDLGERLSIAFGGMVDNAFRIF